MPRNRVNDETRQPILQDAHNEEGSYNDNELAEITCCDPRAGWYRFVALIFMCLVGFGEYIRLIKQSRISKSEFLH
jgi:hypothetical protein